MVATRQERVRALETLPAQGTAHRASLLGPVTFTVVFSVIFTAHSSFTYRGHRYFTLFDDGMISMRYAANLAHGRGLVWNAGGAHVEGYTNFLWTLWMALLHLTGLPSADISLLVVGSCVALLLANLWAVRAVAESVTPGQPQVAAAALWLTAFAYPLLYWSLRGMEVGLLAAVTTAMALAVLRWRDEPAVRELVVLGLLGAIAVLTRTDAVIPFGVAAAFTVAWAPPGRRLRTGAVLTGIIGGTLAVHTAFRVAYYGDPLPNTYYLKLAGAPLGARLQRGMASFLALACASLLPLLALAALALARRARDSRRLLLAAMFAVPAAYSVYVGGDAWEWMQFANRYLATCLTLLIVLAAVGIAELVSSPYPTRIRLVVAGGALLLLGLVIAVTETVPTGTLQYSLRATGDVPLRELLVVTAVLVLGVWVLRSRRVATIGAGLVVVTVAVITSGQALSTWVGTNGLHVQDDNTMAIYGLELRQATSPDAVVAVVWAGAGPYFDGRPAVDLLGKSDPHIAKEPMHRGITFYPGHTKWDYAWSIGHLQPDLVAGLVRPTADDLDNLRAWGYDELRPGVWVLRSSPRVDRQLLLRLMAETPRVGELISRVL